MSITIGSVAAYIRGIRHRPVGADLDVIMTYDQFQTYLKASKADLKACYPTDDSHFVLKYQDGRIEEVEIAWPGTSAEMLMARYPFSAEPENWNRVIWASANELYAIKMSHRYKKNSPHHYKTMADIHAMRAFGCEITEDLQEFYQLRQKESYTYNHPKLDVTSKEFFAGDGVNYIYQHDSLHQAVAIEAVPAYTYYLKDGSEVMTSREKFFACNNHTRLLGVYEESCVLALERSQIPYDFKPDPRKSFEIALMKVQTSITSGWFREFAWENHQKVIDVYESFGYDDYIRRFKANQHLLRPFE